MRDPPEGGALHAMRTRAHARAWAGRVLRPTEGDIMTALLLEIGAALPFRCSRCDALRKTARASCRRCDRGDLPAPGGAAWNAWTRGIARVIRRRLDARGFGAWEIDALKWLVYNDPFNDARALPDEVAALLADIAALPCANRRYHEARKAPRLRLVAAPRLRVSAPADDGEAEREALAEAETPSPARRATR